MLFFLISAVNALRVLCNTYALLVQNGLPCARAIGSRTIGSLSRNFIQHCSASQCCAAPWKPQATQPDHGNKMVSHPVTRGTKKSIATFLMVEISQFFSGNNLLFETFKFDTLDKMARVHVNSCPPLGATPRFGLKVITPVVWWSHDDIDGECGRRWHRCSWPVIVFTVLVPRVFRSFPPRP